ncbi:outer membrane protein TolC [Kordia periserrulae]|uniref:Outer membrane protein TolC n=1 Tax=Kordia periserrulae TaxID=701523 RepID=A0A2T6C1V5_9FLAO|nr:TolC family protein [Kordia periserrulae]PTX62299.1 outer membrane protein TolC [Kordia periserrulae]
MKRNFIYIIVGWWCIQFANGQTLESYLAEAEKNSSEILAQQLQYESTLEKVNEVGSLPNTQVGVGVFAQEVETRVGPQKARFSASQQIPWFGILKAKKENAKLLATAKESEIDFLKRQLRLNVKMAYYNLYTLQQKYNITQQHIEILDTYEKLALNELENNRSNMVDVLHIKMKKNELQQQFQEISETIQSEKAQFNVLLNRPITAEVLVLDSLQIQENTILTTMEMLEKHPKLQQLDAMEEVLQQSEIVAKKEGNPKIGFGLDYVLVAERSGVSMPDNGKDIIMPMVSVSIPLFNKKHVSKQKQLQLEQEAIVQNKTTVKNQLRIAYEQAKNKLKNAMESIKIQEENITQANQAKEVILAAYQTDKMDFEQLLALDQLKLGFEMKKINDFNTSLANTAIIEFLITN